MTRRSARLAAGLAAGLAALLASGCTSDVVDGRALSASGGSTAAPLSGARFTDPAVVARLRSEVEAGVEAVNSYDYRTLDASRTTALRYTTGGYRAEYERTFRSVVARNAPTLQATQRARVADVGVASLTDKTAYLLVFGQLEIRTKNAPTGRKDPFTVIVRSDQVSGRWLVAQVSVGGSRVANQTGSPGLQDAVRRAGAVAKALSTLSRATFGADWANALALLTGSLRSDFTKLRASTLKTLTDGNLDIAAEVLAEAAVSASGSRAVVLVSMRGYQVKNGTRQSGATAQRLRLTMVSAGGRWLADKIDSIGVS